MRRLALGLAGMIVLIAPFGEGGRAPLALALLQTIALAGCLLALLATDRSCRVSFVAPGGDAHRLVPRVGVVGRVVGHLLGHGERGGLVSVVILAGLGCLGSLLAATRASYPYAAGLGLMDRWVPAALLVGSIVLFTRERDVGILRNLLVASTLLQAIAATARGWNGGAAAAGTTFLNPNHLAGFLNLGLLCCAAVATASPWRPRSAAWITLGLLHLPAILLLESRGALVGLLGGGLLLIVVRWRDWSPRARRIAAETLLVIAVLGGATLLMRFSRAEDPFRFHRVSIWKASLEMIADSPWIGHGPGMFRHLSPVYNFPLEEGPVRYGRIFYGAHSSLLTSAVEDGVPVSLLFMAAALAGVRLLSRRRPDGARDAAAEGIALALGAVILHAAVDDILERPAITFVMAILIGAAIGARRPAGVETSSRLHRLLSPRFSAAATAVVAISIWVGAIFVPFLAHREATLARSAGRDGLARMERAARLNRIHPEYQHDLAMARLNEDRPAPERYALAYEHLKRARSLKPTDYRFPLMMARLEDQFGRTVFVDGGSAGRARELYARAVELAPRDPRPRLEQAGHLEAEGRFDEAIATLSTALEIEPHFRRARILQISLFTRLGRRDEAAAAGVALARTDAILVGYRPDSSYAVDLTRDAPERRAPQQDRREPRETPRLTERNH